MDYILNTDAKNPPKTIVQDGYLWRLVYMNDAEKGFYVRTNRKVRGKV